MTTIPSHKLAEEYGLSAEFLFAYQSDSFNTLGLGGEELPLCFLPVKSALSKLNLMVFKRGERYSYRCAYRSDLYREEIVSSFLKLFGCILHGFVRGGTLSSLPLCDEEELKKLDGFCGEEISAESFPVELFAKRAKESPNAPALVVGEKTFTYGELDELSNRLAAELERRKLGRGDFVPVLIGRNEFMAIASLGVLKSGAAYEPLDPTYPPERLSFMIKDAKARLLICDRALAGLTDFGGDVLYTDEISALPAATPAARPEEKDAFILLYTSGTTGTPKGCVLEHGCLASFVAQYLRTYGLDASSRVAAYASYGFDACMMDMYPVLAAGGTLYLIDAEMRLDLFAINDFFEKNKITNAFMTTQVGRAFAASMHPSALKTLSVGGERLVPLSPPEGYTLYNLYGPTECTVYSNLYRVDKDYYRIPIGRPAFGIKEYVLDSEGRRLPVGATGELYIAGKQVARGYLDRPEKTAEVFLENPFAGGYARMYRTGDVVRFLPDGSVDFVGRKDGQVKIRGFRVELSEVEGAILAFRGVKNAAVIAVETPSGGKELAAFVTGEKKIDLAELKKSLAAEKPPYMVPASIVWLDEIPSTRTAKWTAENCSPSNRRRRRSRRQNVR